MADRNRFLVFVGQQYYPGRGWVDFVGSAFSEHEALMLAASRKGDWWQVVDLELEGIAEEGVRG